LLGWSGSPFGLLDDGDMAKARFSKGMLTVVLPKSEEARTRSRSVKIESQ
jgi:HSP20 family molecular chaperone IbpA